MEYYWINSNEKHYKGAYKRWLRDGFAATYGSRERYGVLLREFNPADILFMYVNKAGIVAIGEVKEKWDGQAHVNSDPDQKTDVKHEYRIPVSWEIIPTVPPYKVTNILKRPLLKTTIHLKPELGEELYNCCISS